MAELDLVYNTQLEESNRELGAESFTGPVINGGAMNGGAMNGGAMNSGAMNGGAMNSGAMNHALDDEVDKTINKLKNNIQKQKKLNSLKQELKNTSDEPSSVSDKYVRCKKDMYKLFIMALIILLGLSMNDIIKFYLNKYLINNELTNNNEMYLRLAVPLSVLFLIWTVKALTK